VDVEQVAVNTIKALAMDGVQRANSGHPGMPMGMADVATVLWSKFLCVDPTDPTWPDRDRFVLSNGHGSMLLYALLHLSGFPLSLDDLRDFRQWGSQTPGHPEREPHLGIEMTTGPLGQGFGTAVGMAIAEAHLRGVFGPDLVDHRTFAFVSDGDLMEGISSEAASLAGHLGLGRLTYVYDDNEISIGGSTDVTFTESVADRLAAFAWHTVDVDGHDRVALAEAIAEAVAVEDRPSLVIAHTHIAHGSPNLQDTAASHGSPLGADEIAATKEAMGWPADAEFLVPDEARGFFAAAMAGGTEQRKAWEARRDAAFEADPDLAGRWAAYFGAPSVGTPPIALEAGEKAATRKSSGRVINALAPTVPGLVGGSADLAPSTNTIIDGADWFQAGSRTGRNFRFGVREHAMAAAVNGMAIHGGLRPYGATFLVFSDYMRPSIRLAALMGAPSIFVFTHDSVFLGEDGPTHQPVEHLASLRSIPNLRTLRPGSAAETAEAWAMALERTDGPTAIVLTRQSIPEKPGVGGPAARRGGYVVSEGDDVVLVGTGSETWVAVEAAALLAERGVSARVVSMPSVELFCDQDDDYRRSVLGIAIPRVSIEAASTFGWERVTGLRGLRIGIDRFGASAPWERIAEEWGFTPSAVADRVEAWLGGLQQPGG
jgi:transketolase